MATLAMVRKAAAAVGATVEDEKDHYTHECRVEAPHRKFWCDGGVHELVDSAYRPWKPDYADVLSRMNHGLEDCVGDCDWCDGE